MYTYFYRYKNENQFVDPKNLSADFVFFRAGRNNAYYAYFNADENAQVIEPNN